LTTLIVEVIPKLNERLQDCMKDLYSLTKSEKRERSIAARDREIPKIHEMLGMDHSHE
jgi:hypothetical protein